MPRTHYLPDEQVHFTWDEANEPVLTIESGDTVIVDTRDVSDGQITPESDASVLATLDWDRVYPLAGPIRVEGAEPGDTLAVEIVELEALRWGWTAVIPGFGLLADDFTEPYLRIFDLTGGRETQLREDVRIPIEPFLGTMGVCPAGASAQAVMPPGTFGGNMDTRQLTRGTTLYLPVQVEGALFSCGDAHAAQGDGEVCVTGIETPMYATLRLTLEHGRSIPAPQFQTAGAADAEGRRRRVLRHDGSRAGSLRRRAGIDPGDGRPPLAHVRPLPRGCLRPLQPRRRPQDLRDRGRRGLRGQRAAAARGLPARIAAVRLPARSRGRPEHQDAGQRDRARWHVAGVFLP